MVLTRAVGRHKGPDSHRRESEVVLTDVTSLVYFVTTAVLLLLPRARELSVLISMESHRLNTSYLFFFKDGNGREYHRNAGGYF